MILAARNCALCLLTLATATNAQQETPDSKELAEQLRKLQERMEALESRHDADQKRIEELESRLNRVEESPPAQPKELPSAEPAQTPAAPETAPSSGLFDLSASGISGNSYNPQMTVIIDSGGSVSSDSNNKALNRFNMREVELDLRAAVTPEADGVLILSLPEEIESNRRGEVEINTGSLEIEEGYLNFHTLPHDMALKFGKFRADFGTNNTLHTHDLPQVTRPLAVQAFLGPEGLSSLGASWSWLVPNPWNQYVELTAEVINADGGEASPILGGPNADNPAINTHLKWFKELTPASSLELGGSYLYTHTTSDSDFDANVFALNAAYSWTHPDPSKFRSFLLQAEAYYAQNDVQRAWWWHYRNTSFGAYAFAQYQIGRDWYVGLRGDYTEFPNSQSRGNSDYDIAFSPYVTWYWTEFLRFRLEYQHRMADVWKGEIWGHDQDEDAVFLQMTGVFGSHPAHPYWVRR